MSWGSLKTKRPSIPLALQREWLPVLDLQVLRTRKLFGLVRPVYCSLCLAEPLDGYGKNCVLEGQKLRVYPSLNLISCLAFTKSLLSGTPSPHQKARGEDHRGPGAISPTSVLLNKNWEWFKELTCRPGFF